MDNNFDFKAFETPALSEEEIENKARQKELRQRKNNKKNLAVKIMFSSAAALIIIILLFCGYLLLSPSHNSERLVASYLSEIEKADWKNVYSMLNFENSYAIDEKQFIDFCNENPTALLLTEDKIIDFQIEKDKVNPDSGTVYYSVNYICSNGTNGTVYITAAKTNDKNGFFASYGIIPSQSCFCSLNITAPPETEITIDNKTIKTTENKNGKQLYQIKYLLPQSITINAKNKFCNDYQQDAVIDSKYNSLNICPEISKDCFIELCNDTKNNITAFYTDIINNSEDYGKYSIDSDYKESGFEKDINNIKNNVMSGNYTVSDFKVTEATLQKTYDAYGKELNKNGKNEIEIKYNFTYSYIYTYNDENGEAVSAEKTDSGYFGIKYVLKDKWYICGINTNAWF